MASKDNATVLNPSLKRRNKDVDKRRLRERRTLRPSADEGLYVDHGMICMEKFARLPLDRCIKTNAPTEKVVFFYVRNPFNPFTWWGKRQRRLTIGLCGSALTRLKANRAIVTALLVAATIMVPLGFLLNPWLLAGSGLSIIIAGTLRSRLPIWAADDEDELLVVKGACSEFMRQFDQYDNGVPLN